PYAWLLRVSFSFLDLARQLCDPFLDCSRVVHRAEFGAAHPAKLGALEVFRRQRLVVVLLRPLRIEAQSELFFPGKCVPTPRESIVAIACTLSATGDVSGMCGDFVCDHALSHIISVRQSKVLFRR